MLFTWIVTTVLLWCTLTKAETHVYNFNITYVDANPDGMFERRVIGINNEWPIPIIRVKQNDRVIIHVENQLEASTALHFHGLFQKGQSYNDGAQMLTQCGIAPGYKFTYNFTVDDQVGTYWYHSHSGSQYADGLRGLFIIEEADKSKVPFEYDEELTLTVSEWYHAESVILIKNFLSRYNPTGAEPIPQNSLFNDTKNVTIDFKPDTTYFMRISNVGLFTSQYLHIEDHSFTIVEVDGVYVEPYEVETLYISTAQRYGVLIKSKKNPKKNYRFYNIIDKEMLDVLPQELQLVSTNIISYGSKFDTPKPYPVGEDNYDKLIAGFKEFDDFSIVPLDKQEILGEPDVQVALNFVMENLGDGVNYALFNGKSYTTPKVPTLYTVMSSGKYAEYPEIYGSNTNSFVLQKDEVIEIVLNNLDPGKHPFHLHGHNFQVIKRSEAGEDDSPITYDPSTEDSSKFPEIPLKRDTVLVNPNGYIILRFKATNPGVWFFHCHLDWHLEQGLAITFIEAPTEIQKQVIPEDHYNVCKGTNTSIKGNAAGNYGDSKEAWFDLTGEPLQPEPLPEGFTTKGYVAFALCTILAIHGLFTIFKYGMEDVKADNNQEMIAKLHSILSEYGANDDIEGISLQSDIRQASASPGPSQS